MFKILLPFLLILSIGLQANEKETRVILQTTQGNIELILFDDIAPLTVENFTTHVKNGYFNGVAFHRIIKGFMIQGGDPSESGFSGESIWGKPFKDEFKNKTFNKIGILAMANSGPHTNGSQFFITTTKTPWLNGRHTIFGEVSRNSLKVIMKLDKIATHKYSSMQEKKQKDKPIVRQEIIKAYILSNIITQRLQEDK
ncbi:peptidylprolyl isomerase [Sulfurimonas sp.]|uniref:peptidylprolyl isomerase n=1 Tax=Sulfurimonas sp. TaxID=2022749 RepID=UPI002B486D14|nr:peptidylprolyl isomerase [Sulfurimonas sp.]